MLNFKNVEEVKQVDKETYFKERDEKINKLLHQYNAKKVLTPEQEVQLSKIHDMELDYPEMGKDLVEKCGMKKLFRGFEAPTSTLD
jgi:hypothetical protein